MLSNKSVKTWWHLWWLNASFSVVFPSSPCVGFFPVGLRFLFLWNVHPPRHLGSSNYSLSFAAWGWKGCKREQELKTGSSLFVVTLIWSLIWSQVDVTLPPVSHLAAGLNAYLIYSCCSCLNCFYFPLATKEFFFMHIHILWSTFVD